MRSPTLRRFIAAFVIAAVLIGTAAPTFLRTWSGRKYPGDFGVVYGAARAMSNQADSYAGTHGMYIYSPFLAFIFQPLAALPEGVAANVWLVLSTMIIFAASMIAARKVTESWRLSARETDPSIPWLISAAALLLSVGKVRSDLYLGQTDCLILIGLAGVLYWIDPRPLLAGVVVGATANVKYLALIFVPYFLIKRNYRAAIASIVSFLFFFALPAVEVGLRAMKTYAINAIAVLTKVVGGVELMNLAATGRSQKPVVNSAAWSNSVSLTSSVLRFTRSHGISDLIAAILLVLLFAAIVTAIVLIGRREGVDLLKPTTATTTLKHGAATATTIDWAALIVLALVFSPQTTSRHMILLMLVYTAGVGIVFGQKRTSLRILLIVSMLATAVALSLPFRETGFHPWLIALKSFGTASWCAVLLILLIAWIGSRTISEATEQPQD